MRRPSPWSRSAPSAPRPFARRRSSRRNAGAMSLLGQHIELGTAEAICFHSWRHLASPRRFFARGCCTSAHFYDPFIRRAHDALNYACYQDARFIAGGDPSGITLAPEGGAHLDRPRPADGADDSGDGAAGAPARRRGEVGTQGQGAVVPGLASRYQ
jgi:pyruvate dehydrogenase complex dehydrogenase (E1) component